MKTWKKWLIVVFLGTIFVHGISVLAYPKAMIALVMYITEMRAGGVNKMFHPALANARVREVVRPSPDMLYSVCIIDVSDGPVKVRTLANKPYTSITVFASNSDNIFAINDLQEVNGELEVVIARSGSRGNNGDKVANLPTSRGIALIRYVFTDEVHMKEIDKNRKQAECRRI